MKGQKRVHGEIEGDRISAREEVFRVVRAIPSGRIMTYGQISTVLASRLSPVAPTTRPKIAGPSTAAKREKTL